MMNMEYSAPGVSRRTGYLIMEWRPQPQHSRRYWISKARLRRHTSTHRVAEKQRSRACRTTTTIPVRDISWGRRINVIAEDGLRSIDQNRTGGAKVTGPLLDCVASRLSPKRK